MDPNVAMILGALVAGMADTATKAVKDAYEGLKDLLHSKFAENQRAQLALTEHAEDPDIFEKPLVRQLELTGASRDPLILTLAEKVLNSAQAAGVQIKYQNQISGGRQAIGDGAVFKEK